MHQNTTTYYQATTAQPGIAGQPNYIVGQPGYTQPVGTTAVPTSNHTHCLPTHYNTATVTFRPIEGKFIKDTDLIGKMDPYCKFKLGWHTGKSRVTKGLRPLKLIS